MCFSNNIKQPKCQTRTTTKASPMVFGLRPHTNNKWDRNFGFTKSPSPSRGSTNTGNTDRFVKIIPGSRFQFWPSVAGTTCTRMPSSGSSTTCQTAAESSGRGHTTGQMWPCLDLKYVMKSGYPCSGFYQFKTFNVRPFRGTFAKRSWPNVVDSNRRSAFKKFNWK